MFMVLYHVIYIENTGHITKLKKVPLVKTEYEKPSPKKKEENKSQKFCGSIQNLPSAQI